MVYGSTVPAQGRFRRQIGTESCHRVGSRVYQRGVLSVQVRMHIGMRLVGSQGISVATVIGFVAAADTGSSFFCGLLAALLV